MSGSLGHVLIAPAQKIRRIGREDLSNIDVTIARGKRYHQAGQLQRAEQAYHQVLRKVPDHAIANHLLGVAVLQRGDPHRALAFLGAAVAKEPGNPEYETSLAGAQLATAQPENAAASYRRVAEARPDDAEILFNLGYALAMSGRNAEAVDAYRRSVAVQPDYFQAWNNLGALLLADGRSDEAITCLRRLIELQPEHTDALCNLAKALEMTSALVEARTLAERALGLNPRHAPAHLLLATLDRRAGRLDEARDRLLGLLGSKHVDAATTGSAHLELGHVLDRLGDYEAAFAAFHQGNELRARLPAARQREPERVYTTIAGYRSWLTAERVAAWTAVGPNGSAPPIFFVGFPRSGTTLMEQMLAAHPNILTTGERSPLSAVMGALPQLVGARADYPALLADLTPQQIEALQLAFWESARANLGPAIGERRLVDKNPLNIIELGLIARIFPAARIIVALRDPRDVCLSCYVQEFEQNAAMVNFFDLDGTARFYAAVMDLWCHYREIMPSQFLEYRYEDLVRDPETTMHRVLDFVGEPWDAEVLRHERGAQGRLVATPSRDAVSRALHDRAVGRWRHYRDHLGPILPHIDRFVREFGYQGEAGSAAATITAAHGDSHS